VRIGDACKGDGRQVVKVFIVVMDEVLEGRSSNNRENPAERELDVGKFGRQVGEQL